MLEDNGYEIKILNTINFKKSMKYNPFAYLRSEKDILKLVQTIIANTKGKGEKAGEDFWGKAEKLYYTALIGYIWYEAPFEEKNFATLLDMIDASEVREDDETYMNPIDRLFEALEKKEPTHFAVKQYKKYKLAAGKTAKSILISCGARNGFVNIYHYTDDGVSGTTFDREGFQKMIKAVEENKVSTVIVKDMSRFGRDYLKVGFYTEILFKEKGVRFIAINNGIDSEKQAESDFTPFLNIMNEWYARDTSRKIQSIENNRLMYILTL